MNLYVLRHASAGTRRANPVLDTRRPLDKQGKRDCLLLGNTLSSMKVSFDLIVSSPLKRSLQTASLVGTETGYEQKILLSDALAPAATYPQFQSMLAECASYESLLVVGHSPPSCSSSVFFCNRIQQTRTALPRPAAVRLRKGAIARVTFDRGASMLQWMLEPRIVRSLYASSTTKSRRKTSRK